MKLVQFENGLFGLRAGWFFGWRFVDLGNPNDRLRRTDIGFVKCQGLRRRCEEVKQNLDKRGYKIVKDSSHD